MNLFKKFQLIIISILLFLNVIQLNAYALQNSINERPHKVAVFINSFDDLFL